MAHKPLFLSNISKPFCRFTFDLKSSKSIAFVGSPTLSRISPCLDGPYLTCKSLPIILLNISTSWFTLVDTPVQTLKTWPFKSLPSRAHIIAWTISSTCMKSLLCFPSPSIVKISWLRAFWINFVITPHYKEMGKRSCWLVLLNCNFGHGVWFFDFEVSLHIYLEDWVHFVFVYAFSCSPN